ncbi:hypothetical protein CF327_g3362 [Tilletia walkeri]|uniref:NADAR domain-containing protein n=1 Tax=Tilletia walkeri TaxID=117179 RepID=A0A8X7NG56_9BASI|nr:hypothetical protein CF327_g3362 [Tilletia walkeri]KAE8271405.1 hypothetical protein A4X09_0g923 [Tilletia walkeri]
MEDIEIVSSSELSSARSVTPTVDTEDATSANIPIIYFGVETEPFFFLCPLFPSRISLGDHQFLTAEAFFQAARFAKHPNLVTAIKNTAVFCLLIPILFQLFILQRWSKHVPHDWEERRLEVMKEVQTLKYAQYEQLRARLIQTGDCDLIYKSNTDNFFGCGQDGQGLNHLGRILMDIRTSSRMSQPPSHAPLLQCFPDARMSPGMSWSSTVWCANNASEKWHPHAQPALKEVTIYPAVANAVAYKYAFLHGIVHGDEPWTLDVIVQLHSAAVEGDDGPQVKFTYWHSGLRDSRSSEVYMRLASENLKWSSRGIYIYSFTLKLNQWHSRTPYSTISITFLPSKSTERDCHPIRPDHTLSVAYWE